MNNMIVIRLMGLFLFVLMLTILMAPDEYPEGTCELAAKEVQKEFGGQMVLVFPYLNGQYVPGKYSGAWINRMYMKGNDQYFYIDYPGQNIFSTKEDAQEHFTNAFRHKFDSPDIEARLFVYGEDPIPFPVIWNY